MSDYWAWIDQAIVIASLKGVFAAASMADNLLAIFSESIAGQSAATRLTAYVNGMADSNVATVTVATGEVEGGGEFVIGPSWWGYQWGTEAYDEVGVWQRALSADEVSQLYNGGDGLGYELF